MWHSEVHIVDINVLKNISEILFSQKFLWRKRDSTAFYNATHETRIHSCLRNLHFFISLPAGMNWIARQNTPLSRNEPESVGLRPMWSVSIQAKQYAGISTTATSTKFMYLSPANATEFNDSP